MLLEHDTILATYVFLIHESLPLLATTARLESRNTYIQMVVLSYLSLYPHEAIFRQRATTFYFPGAERERERVKEREGQRSSNISSRNVGSSVVRVEPKLFSPPQQERDSLSCLLHLGQQFSHRELGTRLLPAQIRVSLTSCISVGE